MAAGGGKALLADPHVPGALADRHTLTCAPQERLRRATQWYPYPALASILAELGEADVGPAFDSAVLDDARQRLAVLASENLRRAERTRQPPRIHAAIGVAEGQADLVEAGELDRARSLVAQLEAVRSDGARADPAPAGTYPTDRLICPAHIDAAVTSPFARCAGKTTTATRSIEYWGGDLNPWRHGLGKAPVTDADVIAVEQQHKASAEATDESTAGTAAHADMLRGCGIRLDFLLALTFALEMWDWKTWEVVQHLVKPMTEGAGRCRFAELPNVQRYTGAATVFMVSGGRVTWVG